jgi:hypothetical protein
MGWIYLTKGMQPQSQSSIAAINALGKLNTLNPSKLNYFFMIESELNQIYNQNTSKKAVFDVNYKKSDFLNQIINQGMLKY